MRPEGVSDKTIEALGKLSEAFEWVIRARGRLYDLHQMIGHADALLDNASSLLERAGHVDEAERLRTDIIGRNVLQGRWTFQVVEEFDRTYFERVAQAEKEIMEALVEGRRHIYEAEMKEERRTSGRTGHEKKPD